MKSKNDKVKGKELENVPSGTERITARTETLRKRSRNNDEKEEKSIELIQNKKYKSNRRKCIKLPLESKIY